MSKKITFKPHQNGGSVDWKVGNQAAGKHKTKVRKDSGAEALNFSLSNDAIAAGYKFDTSDPIWVCEDNGRCPSSPSAHGQIKLLDATDSSVSVADLNTEQVTLRYQLNVTNGKGARVPIDPIIQNVL
ncbi:MAG TPA: hypothetical protein VHN55_00560 [Sphingomicrobium sp.]|nr:hypothetical protein [Sphingomicrobium sp.]